MVETAADGQAAWERLDGDPSRFALMLLDRQMPRLDGISLLKRIKADSRFKELPVIMLTGSDRQDDIVEGLAAGAYYYLTKPATEEVLTLVIRNALGERQKQRDLRASIGQQANNVKLIRRAEFCYRNLAEARDLALLLAEASTNPERTVNGYSELLINAVEHGNLGISYEEKGRLLSAGHWAEEVNARLRHPDYASREVTVTLEKTPTVSRVTIADQGQGFDWQAYVEFSPERVFDQHGRGIAMSRAISFDSLDYLGNGSTVVTTVRTHGSR
jgi:CheY-like chemotaxis protein